jgi:hypothetical protein
VRGAGAVYFKGLIVVRHSLPLFALAASLSLTGCQPEEKVSHVKRPRLNDMKRLLAVIILPDKNPEEEKTWFFKALGAESEIEPLVELFNKFVRSVKFTNPETPTWELPESWSEEKDKGKKLRYATIHMGPRGKAPELTVTALRGQTAASVPANVIRWRIQLGLKDNLGERDVEDFYRPVTVAGRAAVFVDMIGPRVPEKEPEVPGPSFKYQTPDGWEEIPPTSKFYVLSFIVAKSDQKADMNVSELPGGGGGLVLNVNRWRGQLKLDELPAEQVNALPEATIGNAKGKLVDITGPDAPPQRNRILGAILIRGSRSLFFKMTGPSDLVERQKPVFETFLKSIDLGG